MFSQQEEDSHKNGLGADNGKTFKSAAKALTLIVQHLDVQRYFAGIRMEWSFNLAKAPWCGGEGGGGGIFERMVQLPVLTMKHRGDDPKLQITVQ